MSVVNDIKVTPEQLEVLADAALDRHFSPGRAERLRYLMREGNGLSLDVVARAHKVLLGLGVNPSNDHHWGFFLSDDDPKGLELWDVRDGTLITITVFRS